MKKMIALLLALAMTASLAACGSSGSSTTESSSVENSATAESSSGGEAEESSSGAEESSDGEMVSLSVGSTDVLGSFLLGSTVGSNHRGASLAFDFLFEYDEDGNQSSRILEDYYYEDDCTIILKLKDGIYFSNGEQMTGEDILYSIFNYAERSSSIAAVFEAFSSDLSYVEDDGLTVVLKTETPYGPGLEGCGRIPIYCKSWGEEVGYDSELWITDPVGSGPYECVEFVTDSYFVMQLRDDYWDDTYTTNIEQFTVYYYSEGSTMFIDLENGVLDIALNLSVSDYERCVAGVENIAYDAIASKDVVFLSLDVDGNEYLANEKVREAIAYGVDWSEVATAARSTAVLQATSLIASDSEYYYDVGAYEYDPDRAAEALAESGYDGSEISLNMVSTNEEQKDSMFAVIQYYLSQLGIEYTLENYDFGTALVSWLEEGGTDSIFQDSDTGSTIGEPFVSLRYLMIDYSPFPVCSIADETFDTLCTEALAEVDSEARYELYKELQEYVHDTYLVMPIYENADVVAWRTDVVENPNFASIECALNNVTLVG